MNITRLSAPNLDHLPKGQAEEKRLCTKKISIFDCIRLLVSLSVPLAIAIFTIVQKNNEEAIAKENRLKDSEIAQANRAHDEKIADDQRKENILVEYQNSVAKLLVDYGMTLNESESARFVVRVKTLTAVRQLDFVRKSFLIQSLFEANLITTKFASEPIISLESADLTKLDIGNSDGNTERPSHPCLSLNRVIMNNASFRREVFVGASFVHAYIRFGDFTDSMTMWLPPLPCYDQPDLKYVNFESTVLNDTIFSRALFEHATFSYAEMYRTNLQGFDCHECEMIYTKLSQSDLTRATFLGPANLMGLKLIDSQLINARFMHEIDLHQADMTRVNAAGVTIDRCTAWSAILVNGSFDQAIIKDSNFYHAQITGASMTQIRINNTIFDLAQLINVNFSHAMCHHCMFIGAVFTGSNLQSASFIASNFTDATISDKQLAQAASLLGSILPNGTIVIN